MILKQKLIFFAHTSKQLLDDNTGFLQRILNEKWSYENIGEFSVPSELSRSVRCWDSSRAPEKDDLFRSFFTRCSNERSIYLDIGLEVGTLDYEYNWLESDGLHPARFYNRYEYINSSMLGSSADQNDVTNFSCNTRFVNVDAQEFKISICRRGLFALCGTE